MRRLTVITLALGFFALAAMPAQAQTVGERNADHLWSLVGAIDPNTPTTMPDGRVIPLAQAIDEAAARAGTADLTAMASGAVLSPDTYVGDVWLISIGLGDCTINHIAPSPVPITALHPQFWTYSGGVGTMSGDATYGLSVISWTMKTSGFYAQAHWEITGITDFYCFNFSGLHLAFPFVNGIAQVTPS